MAKVKGSPQRALKIVQYSPARQWRLRIMLLLWVIMLCVLCYRLGYWQWGRQAQHLIEHNAQLQQQLDVQQQRLQQLHLATAQSSVSEQMQSVGYEELRKLNSELQAQIMQLQDENTLYKGIMAPSPDSPGLRIETLTVTAVPQQLRHYQLKLLLTQVGDNRAYIQGVVGINLKGLQGDEAVVLPLKDLSADVDSEDIRLRYRYFQDVRAELTLPEGFVPEQVQVVVQSTGARSLRVEKMYQWSLISEVS